MEGDRSRAAGWLEEAVQLLERVGMKLYTAAARRHLGRLLGGDRGRELVSQADAWLSSEGVRNPARLAAMLTPGFGTDP